MQIRRKHLLRKTNTEPWMISEKAFESSDTTRSIFLSPSPRSDAKFANKEMELSILVESFPIQMCTFSPDFGMEGLVTE